MIVRTQTHRESDSRYRDITALSTPSDTANYDTHREENIDLTSMNSSSSSIRCSAYSPHVGGHSVHVSICNSISRSSLSRALELNSSSNPQSEVNLLDRLNHSQYSEPMGITPQSSGETDSLSESSDPQYSGSFTELEQDTIPHTIVSQPEDATQPMTILPSADIPTLQTEIAFFLADLVQQKCVILENKTITDDLITKLDALLDITHVPHPSQVVNLSNRVLNSHELAVLQKGLSFCPTPGEPKMGDLVNDLDYFHDNLRWEYFFKDNPLIHDPFEQLVMNSKALKKRYRPPPPPAHRNLEAFNFLNERDLQGQTLRVPHARNLTLAHKTALRNLKKDPHITIKEADKGGAVVILNTTDYIAEAHRQLADHKFYRPVDHDMTAEFSDRIEKYLLSLHKKGTNFQMHL